MSVLLEFSIYPLDKGESVSKYVVQSLEIIAKSGLNYRLGPMGTVLEGNWDEVMIVVKKCYERMKQDCNRIACHISIDYRNEREAGLTSKIDSVKKRTGIELKT